MRIPLLLPGVPAGFSSVLPLTVSLPTSESFQSFQLQAWTGEPQFDSPLLKDWLSCLEASGYKVISAIEEKVPGVGCVLTFSDLNEAAIKQQLEAAGKPLSQQYWALGDDVLAWYNTTITCSTDVALIGGVPGLLIDEAGKLELVGPANILQAISACGHALVNTLPTAKTVSAGAPVDPNGKAGSTGVGQEQWVSGAQPLSYEVFFANEPTATAPAQTVTITDQLDPAKVDLSSFALGPIAFGTQVLIPLPGQTAYSTDVDLRPGQNLIVRIAAQLDRSTGLVTWTYTSIDPTTGQPPTDPTVGFLPPDVNPPSGEGFALYTINPTPGLATGTQVSNQATVVFDVNPPINTAPWVNTIDNTPPQSEVTGVTPSGCPQTFNAQWSGGDVGSGIHDYTIFASENGSPFTPWQVNTAATDATFTGQCGSTYGFYSVARDNVGNVEAMATGVQVTANIPASGCVPHDFAVTKVAAPKTLKLTTGTPAMVKAKVQIQNRSSISETIPDAATLQNLVVLNLMPLGSACTPAPVVQLHPGPKLPVTLPSKKKLNVAFDVTIGCAVDPLKGLGHQDYALSATVNHLALGCGDSYPADDTCPHPPLGIVPFPNGTINDKKGCAGRLVDVVVTP